MDVEQSRTTAERDMAVSGLSTGAGSGMTCNACQQRIEIKHVECRCRDAAPPHATLRFHQWCYYARSLSAK